MKKTFTKEYILLNRGCYSESEVLRLKCIDNKSITLRQLFRDLPIKDFTWWLAKKCDLTLTQKIGLALIASSVSSFTYKKAVWKFVKSIK